VISRKRKKFRRADPAALSDILPGVLREVRPRRNPIEKIRRIWAEVVGPEAAPRTRPLALEQGVLQVEVASAALKHHLSTFRAQEVLDGLRERLENVRIKQVRYRLGDLR
jgi:predicted nucleic acid-binding Zn ribbon protein